MVDQKVITQTPAKEIIALFELQKAHQFEVGNRTAAQRIASLKRLHKAVLHYRDEIKEALYNDFRKHPSEVDMTEVYPVTALLKHVRRNLSRWMRNARVSTPISLFGSSSYIKHEPKGVVLIMSPWNFPFMLTLGPMICAVAAGNTVIVKPSEHTPNASAIMKKIIEETFSENEVKLIEGGVETAKTLLNLPFNHIYFTGAPEIGKKVMMAAAKNLASVTLELGGKSPTIVLDSANIDLAARRIAVGKYVNNGQVCLAPDYVFVHESVKDKFIEAVKKHLRSFYSEEASNEPSYCRMVNNRHHGRVKDLYDDAVAKGATVETGGQFDDSHDYISPTVLTNVPENSTIMKEEIFGPVLPVISFKDLNEVIQKVNSKEKPLALYIYGRNRKKIRYILDNTRAGGSCINHNSVHFFNLNLPFGGSNNSGIGKGNGVYGFKEFSNERAVLNQHIPNAIDLLVPPYNDFKQRLIEFTVKYL
ncbi:MAG: aldehyde dehydrogenase family protein [Bacteroidetes bacterium]|nr:MAG: aldehyde dehydrogenase family protein [Bacteroidota bacterium]